MTQPLDLRPSRRQFLGAVAAAGGTVAAGCSADRGLAANRPGTTSATAAAPSRRPSADTTGRILVVITMVGGNDGLSTLVPYTDGRYHDARPTTALGADDVIDLDGTLGLNKALAPLHERGLAIVAGVGAPASSQSHFDMLARWNAGSADPLALPPTGYLGRFCDRLGAEGAISGVSISPFASRALACERRTTIGLPDGQPLRPLVDATPSSTAALTAALSKVAAGRGRAIEATNGSLAMMLSMDSEVATTSPAVGYDPVGGPADQFLLQLGFASQLLHSDLGVRVIHIPMENADFDTHKNHRARHAVLMNTLADGVTRLYDDIARAGMSDRVLIATTSEFGRRVHENTGGIDHGTASCMLMLGPVEPGVHGEQSSLAKLDEDGNLVPTMTFTRYLATMSEWLGIDPGEVLVGDHRAIRGVLA